MPSLTPCNLYVLLSLIKHFSFSLRIIGRPDTEVKGGVDEDMAAVVPKEQRTLSQKVTVSLRFPICICLP